MRNLAITCLFCSSEPSTTNSTTDATPVLCHRQQELPYTGSGETIVAIRFTLDMSSTACACHSFHMCRHWHYEEPIVQNSIFCSSVRDAGRPGAADILVHWCHVGRQTQRWMPYRARPLQHRRQQQLALQGSMTMSVGPCCTSSVVVNFAHAL